MVAIGQQLEELVRQGTDLSDVFLVTTTETGSTVRIRSWSALKRTLPGQYDALRKETGELEPGFVAFFIRLEDATFAGCLAVTAQQGGGS
ncbi:MAG: hypothetical protein PHX83_14480 [Acidobacteriia bacterium]|nr:hypothetical protein [Terriglobia bacterium]